METDTFKRGLEMNDQQSEDLNKLKCPQCRAQLKQRRSRQPDKCEMVCGGCGQVFDVCNLETLEALKKQSD
jgi:hypothetical protein